MGHIFLDASISSMRVCPRRGCDVHVMCLWWCAAGKYDSWPTNQLRRSLSLSLWLFLLLHFHYRWNKDIATCSHWDSDYNANGCSENNTQAASGDWRRLVWFIHKTLITKYRWKTSKCVRQNVWNGREEMPFEFIRSIFISNLCIRCCVFTVYWSAANSHSQMLT